MEHKQGDENEIITLIRERYHDVYGCPTVIHGVVAQNVPYADLSDEEKDICHINFDRAWNAIQVCVRNICDDIKAQVNDIIRAERKAISKQDRESPSSVPMRCENVTLQIGGRWEGIHIFCSGTYKPFMRDVEDEVMRRWRKYNVFFYIN